MPFVREQSGGTVGAFALYRSISNADSIAIEYSNDGTNNYYVTQDNIRFWDKTSPSKLFSYTGATTEQLTITFNCACKVFYVLNGVGGVRTVEVNDSFTSNTHSVVFVYEL